MSLGIAPDWRNDDGSSEAIPIPFTFSLFGQDYDTLFINNNGNISFDYGWPTYTASGFPFLGSPMVAPFWADVDTRGEGSGLVYYKILPNALIVRYDHVGYFSYEFDKLNDFQVVISDGTSELIPNGHTISFCYGNMDWTTGNASDGLLGFGGTPANVGVNYGNGALAMQIGRFNQPGNNFDGAYGESDGIDFLDNSSISFSTLSAEYNQAPINVSNLCDTIFGQAGDTLVFFFYDDSGQELEFDVQDTSGYFNPIDPDSAGFVIINDLIVQKIRSGDRDITESSYALVIDPSIPDGVYSIVITTSDNDSPPITSTFNYTIQIGEISVNIDEQEKLNITAYINAGVLQFKGLEGLDVEQFTLYNSSGQNILQTNNIIGAFNLNALPSGIYLYTIKANGQLTSGRVLK